MWMWVAISQYSVFELSLTKGIILSITSITSSKFVLMLMDLIPTWKGLSGGVNLSVVSPILSHYNIIII